MEPQKIEDLTCEWRAATWKVIEFVKIDLTEIGRLFKDTYNIIEIYSKEKLVPKEISGLLIEMYEFGSWVSDLDETPLHYLYQEIVSLVYKLNKYFLTSDANTKEIKQIINEKLSVG